MSEFGNGLISIGHELSGYRNQNSTPSALQELAAYQTMTPEQQKVYWNIKRQQQIVNLGGTQAVMDPTGGGSVATQLPVTLKPEDVPVNAAAKSNAVADASARGAKTGAASGTEEVKYIQAPEVASLIKEAKDLLPKATSGGAQTMFRDAAAFFNEATPGSKIDTKLNVLGTKLTAKVPRFEGPQSDRDIAEYKTAAGDLANTKLPYETRLAAADTIEALNNKYLPKDGAAPMGNGVAPSIPAAGTKIRVQNPQGKTGTIDASELPAALANGWKQL